MTLFYLWIAAQLISLNALLSITYYMSISVVPGIIKDLLQSRKGSLTKGKDMKQDLSRAI